MQSWHSLGLGSWLVVGGAIASINSAQAQIIPDQTLPINSSVNTQNNITTISGGTTAGGNLFHSFTEFSVPNSGTAYFNNNSNIRNIFSRVTGSSVSNIEGLLKTNDAANLFLINPNGIIFGRNAKLDIGGSFLATTANAIQFGSQGFFSASNREAPSPLLTVNPTALLFNQITAASIQNNSVAPSELDPSGTFTANGLRVPNGQSLFLVGGNVNIDGGGLYAFGGRVELGGLAGAGTVGLNGDGKNLSLSFPDGVGRSDVSLTNGAIVNVRANDGRSIAINARNFELAGESILLAGIAQGLGSINSKAGNIEVNAQAAVTLKDKSYINNFLLSGATGKAGDVSITTSSLFVTDGTQVSASSFGRGDAGNVTINAQDTVSFDGQGNNGNSSAAFSSLESGAVGKAGDISITTGSLSVTNGALLDASTYGRGDAGNVTITAQDTVFFDGVGSNGLPSVARSNVGAGAVGNAGSINVTAGSLSLTNSGQLGVIVRQANNTLAGGQGIGGNVNINVRDAVTISGKSANDTNSSGIFSSLGSGAVGRAGNISIRTGMLTVEDDAQLDASTYGQGNGGNINVQADSSVKFTGDDTLIFSNVGNSAVGNGGNVNIIAGSVSVNDGAQVNAFTRGRGDAGSVTITARDAVVFDGVGSDGFPSAAVSNVEAGAVGNGGSINITAESLSLTNGGQLGVIVRRASDTLAGGQGIGGNVNINVRDTVTISGKGVNNTSSGIFSSLGSGAVGRGGNINIKARALSVADDAEVNAITYGQGNSGDLTIETGQLVVKNSQVGASTFGKGEAGNLTVRASDSVELSGKVFSGNNINNPAGLFSQVNFTGEGRGGNLTIETGRLSVSDGSRVQVATFGQGDAGNLLIRFAPLKWMYLRHLLRSSSLLAYLLVFK